MEAQTAPSEKPRTDVYSLVTDRIIEQLKQGSIPWQKPWKEAGMPVNGISGKQYRGINMMLLCMMGYEANAFFTFKQVKEIGGKVRRGEKGHPVVFWSPKGEEQSVEDGSPERGNKPVLRYYVVFNLAQCEGIPQRYVPAPWREERDIPAAKEIVSKMPLCPKIVHKENKAYYAVVEDYVNMPRKRNFNCDEEYYATLFHELVHSTGHDSRLARKGVVTMSEFGGELYSKEELVAEIGSYYLCSMTELDLPLSNSAAYLQGWLQRLQGDSRLIVWAAREAQKAVDFILDVKQGENEDAE